MDFAVKGQQHSEKKCHVMVTKPIHAEEDTKFQPNHKCGKSSAPHVGCKARRNLNLLTKDEKAAQRSRRILANRVSARQSSLRKQALCVELARKAAELECENEILKKEKEVAMKKYKSLKSTNESLKAQLNLNGMMANVEVEETQEGLKFDNAPTPPSTSTRIQQLYEKEVAMKKYKSLKSTNESLKAQLNLNGMMANVEVEETQEGLKFDNAPTPPSTSTRIQQLYVCNQPSSLPYITPSSNSVQSAPQNGIVCASKIPVMPNVKTSSLSEYKNPARMNLPMIPFALPYTWWFPVSYFAIGVPPPQSSDLANKHKVTNESSTSSFQKPVAAVKYDQRYPPKMIRGEASTSTEIIGPSVHVYCGKASGKKPAVKKKARSTAVTDGSSEGNVKTVIGLNARQKDAIKRTEVITSAAITSSSSEENEDQTDGNLLRRQMDAFTAAEARKRRKEVVKMKNFHYSRQSQVKISSI